MQRTEIYAILKVNSNSTARKLDPDVIRRHFRYDAATRVRLDTVSTGGLPLLTVSIGPR